MIDLPDSKSLHTTVSSQYINNCSASSSFSTACTCVVGVEGVVVALAVVAGICMIGVDGSGVLAREVEPRRELG